MRINWATTCAEYEANPAGSSVAGIPLWEATVEALPHQIPVGVFAELMANYGDVGRRFDVSVTLIGPDLQQLGPAIVDKDSYWGDNSTWPAGWDRKLYWGRIIDLFPRLPGTYTIQLRVIADGDAPSEPYDLPFVVSLGPVLKSHR